MEWYEVVEGDHSLWEGVSEPYKHTIRAFLVYFHSQIQRHSTERFNFRNGSVGESSCSLGDPGTETSWGDCGSRGQEELLCVECGVVSLSRTPRCPQGVCRLSFLLGMVTAICRACSRCQPGAQRLHKRRAAAVSKLHAAYRLILLHRRWAILLGPGSCHLPVQQSNMHPRGLSRCQPIAQSLYMEKSSGTCCMQATSSLRAPGYSSGPWRPPYSCSAGWHASQRAPLCYRPSAPRSASRWAPRWPMEPSFAAKTRSATRPRQVSAIWSPDMCLFPSSQLLSWPEAGGSAC